MKEKVLFIALNEFNEDLLRDAISKHPLPHLSKMLSFHRTITWTDDTYESDLLEPWVQWVSIHTGLSSASHGIRHLGDVPDLSTPQLWESLSEQGITSGVWGPMNASRGSADQCLFFLPDPWTASELAYPPSLNEILDPLRYVCKNYVQRSNLLLLKKLRKFLTHLHSHGLTATYLKELPTLFKHLLRFGKEPLISFAESLSASLFLSYRKKYNPDFSFLFLNNMAHLQHHHWHKITPEILHGLFTLDQILGRLFADEGILLIANGFSQKNTNDEAPWILYRQIDQALFLKTIGISCKRVEPHMTHDAHLFFSTREACRAAEQILEEATIQGQKLFLVEAYPHEPLKLFYRILFTDPVPEGVVFEIHGKTFPFHSLFKAIVQRTGKHIPQGVLYSNRANLPKQMYNHEIFDVILRLFSLDAAEIKT